MKYFSPTSLILSSVALLVASLPVESSSSETVLRVLTPDDFTPTISHGTWMIEFFSPYCHHCKAFMPTWTKLVEENEHTPGINFAQVNCAVHGDLCSANKVGGYPTINLFRGGEFVEKYNDDRSIELLTAFVNKHAELPVPIEEEVTAPVNPEGTVLVLGTNTFAAAVANGPVFVKFFAPWCGHCKKLKPHWDQLAAAMKDKLVIAEVNCEDNKALCNAEKVEGYPVLNFYPGGGAPKTEYTGNRKFDALEPFATKAISVGVSAIHANQLDQLVRDHDALYLFLHGQPDNRLMKQLGAAAQPLLGSPPIYTSTDPELFARFALPADSPPVILALKDNVGTSATSTYYPNSRTAASTDLDIPELQKWLLVNRLPTALELNTESFQKVMNAPKPPLVVLVGVASRSKDSTIDQIKEVARAWRGSEVKAEYMEKEVVFVWMDATKWGSWMKSQYGIRQENLPAVVLVDHKRLVYWDQDMKRQPLTLTASSVFSGIAGALSGTTPFIYSESYIERTARWLNDSLGEFDIVIRTHPFRAAFLVILSMVIFFLVVKRWFGEDFAEPADYRNGGGNFRKRRLD